MFYKKNPALVGLGKSFIFFIFNVYWVLIIVPPKLVKLNYKYEKVLLLLIKTKLPVPGLLKASIFLMLVVY